MEKSLVIGLKCVVCGDSLETSGDDAQQQIWMTCEQCADGEAVLDIHYDLEEVSEALEQTPFKRATTESLAI